MAAVDVDDPAAVVFVGDRPYDDVHGAKEAGMRAVLVPHSAIPEDQRGHVEGDPDAVVDRLADLLDVLDGWSGEPAGA
jgi:putative hydrolase of the HAD superfamily